MSKFWDWELLGALIIALVPFVLGLLLLEAYGPTTTELTGVSSCHLYICRISLGSGKITYVAVSSLHYVVCAIICFRYWTLLHDASESSSVAAGVLQRSIAPLVFVFMLIPGAFVLLSHLELSYFQLASQVLLDVYCISDAARTCSPKTPAVFSELEFQVASTAPIFTAVLAAATLVTYTSLQVRLFAASEHDKRDNSYTVSYRSIMECLPMYSGILVSAVISSAVWFHLPAKLFGNAIENRPELSTTLQHYGGEMTLFLGVTYTLTALVAIAWPIWRLSRRARELGYIPATGSSWHWTSHQVLNLGNKFLAVLAPLIASLLYNWLEG